MNTRPIDSLSEITVIADFLKEHGLELKGLRRAVGQRFVHGYPKDTQVVKFETGKYAKVEIEGNDIRLSEDKRNEIVDELKQVELPKAITWTTHSIHAPGLPIDGLTFKPDNWISPQHQNGSIFTAIFDKNEQIVMIEERIEREGEHKQCIRWAYFERIGWRPEEPNKLPLWGLEQFKDGGGSTTVVIHEGPKAGRAGRMLSANYRPTLDWKDWVNGHPWRDELKYAAHLAWIGGVNAVDRVDLGVLRSLGVTDVIIIPDNDRDGRRAVQRIAERMKGVRVRSIARYPANFPAGWDIADPMPRKHPPLSQLLRDFTWLSRSIQVPNKRGGDSKTVYVPIDGTPADWFYVRNIRRFVDEADPLTIVSRDDIKDQLAHRAHSGFLSQVATVISRNIDQRVDSLGFYPNEKKIVVDGPHSYLNTWTNPKIKPLPMDDKAKELWLDFWDYHLPDPTERALVQRWVATQIAHPERRHCGLVTFSTTQGTGKTMVFERILKPQIGELNCSQPRPSDFTNKFNDFMLNSALVYADELIAQRGQSETSAYNTAKEFVTSEHITIEPKGQARFKIKNHAAIYITTNSDRPLYMETSDRRWIVAHANESKMSGDLARRLVAFAGSTEGQRMIRWWAEEFESCGLGGELPKSLGDGFPAEPKYIPFGADAPLTDAKSDMLDLATPLAMRIADDMLAELRYGKVEDGTEGLIALSSAYLVRYANDRLAQMEDVKAAKMDAGMLKKHWPKTGWFRTEVNKKRPDPDNGVYRGTRYPDADNEGRDLDGDMLLLSPALAKLLDDKKLIEIVSAETGLYRLPKGMAFSELRNAIDGAESGERLGTFKDGMFWKTGELSAGD